MAVIEEIITDSIADKMGIKPGDELIAINNKPVKDYIDFQFETADNYFVLTIKTGNNSYKEYDIEKNLNQKLGLKFNKIIFDELKYCENKCIFCFIDRLPQGLRNTLYLKDDDYRFSFLQGSFITMTNISNDEFNRIKEKRLSPLNISVHTTNPQLRVEILQNPEAAKIMDQLKDLVESGIKFNAQIVLCPGINDKKELERTINDLEELYPSLLSLGIVPVGITKYNKNIKPYNEKLAEELIQQIELTQNKLKSKYNKNWLYLADEFYLLADKNIPEYEHYNNFPQIENGIGLTRCLYKQFDQLENKLPKKLEKIRSIGIVTGQLGAVALKPVIKKLNNIKNLMIKLIIVKNKFLGETITVTGLITGQDIIDTLKKNRLPETIIIPEVALNDNGFFLDNLTFKDIKKQITNKKIILASNIKGIIEVIVNE